MTRTRFSRWLWCVVATLGLAFPASAATYVSGFVPDWNQPVAEGAGAPVPVGGWGAWCAPASASNLAGHWDDSQGVPVADGTAFPGTTVGFGAGASFKDYLADGFARPAAGAGLPPVPTDVGWYMNTNNGGQALGGGGHTGTYLKDIHVGLGDFLNTTGSGWTTKTRGSTYASSGGVHANAASAFAEIVSEINANRTVIVSWTHWDVVPTILGTFADPAATDESKYVGTYYLFDPAPSADPWGNGEEWNYDREGTGLGHAVTVVGYIPAGAPDDTWRAIDIMYPWNSLPPGPTDWLIVHDNVGGTMRNVVVPMDWNVWVANTTVPEPGTLGLLAMGSLVALIRRRRRSTGMSSTQRRR